MDQCALANPQTIRILTLHSPYPMAFTKQEICALCAFIHIEMFAYRNINFYACTTYAHTHTYIYILHTQRYVYFIHTSRLHAPSMTLIYTLEYD